MAPLRVIVRRNISSAASRSAVPVACVISTSTTSPLRFYKTTDYWYAEHERSLLWNDPAIGIDWPIDFEPQLAAKDAEARILAQADLYE